MLPFTAEILFSTFAALNGAYWPLPVVAPALALAGIVLTLRPGRGSDRALCALLAAAWVWTAIGWFHRHLAPIDFAAPVYAVGFVLQGLLIAWSGVVRGRLVFRCRADLYGGAGLALAVFAAFVWPLVDGLLGHGWPSARVVGLAPGPTALFTLGLLLSAQRVPLRLVPIPLLWTLVAGATAWFLVIPQDLVQPPAGLGALGLILWRDRQRRQR